MTSNEIVQAARRKILETSDEIVSDTTMFSYLNQAYKDVYKRLFVSASVETATIVCASGVCTLPTRYGRMYSPGEDTSGNFYDEVSIADYQRSDRTDIYTIEGGELKVKNTDITSLTVKYYEQPEKLSTSVDPSIDDYFEEPLIYGVVYRAHEDLQDEELSNYYRNRFKEEMKERLETQSGYEESNQRGGEMFTEQRLI